MKIRIGAAGAKEITTSAIDNIAGEMSKDQAFEAMRKIEERVEIVPNPTYGYLMGSLLGENKIDNIQRYGSIDRDLRRLVYVGRLGRNNCAVAFMREANDCTCRYHM